MVSKRSMKLIHAIVMLILLVGFCVITNSIANAPSYIARYFIGPIFVYIPFSLLLIAVVIYIVNMYITKDKMLKIITIVLTCMTIVYYIGCFSLIAHSNIKNYDNIFSIKNIPQQTANNIFFRNAKNVKTGYEQDTSYTWNNSLLVEYSNDYQLDEGEKIDSIYIDMYCFDNFMFSEKIKNKISKTYFHSEYAYNIAETEFDNNSIFVGEKDNVSFKYCYITATNDGKLNQSTYFTVLLEDNNSVFLISIRAVQTERTTINVEQTIDDIIELTNCLWDNEKKES